MSYALQRKIMDMEEEVKRMTAVVEGLEKRMKKAEAAIAASPTMEIPKDRKPITVPKRPQCVEDAGYKLEETDAG